MADTKISGLTALTGANTASGDLLTIVDVSDTTMAATGTNKKITLTELQSAPVSAGTANGVLYLNGSKVATSGSALVFDGTNLGVGVTPSAWSGAPAMDIGSWAGIGGVSGTSAVAVTSNAYYNSGWKYKLGYGLKPALYQAVDGVHSWLTAASGTAGNAITFTQAMTLDASGRLGIGATSLTEYLTVKSPNASTFFSLQTATNSGVYMGNNVGALTLLTASTERARIDTSGNLLVGTTAPTYSTDKVAIQPTSSNGTGIGIAVGNFNTFGIGIYNGYTATGTATALQFQDHNSVVRGSITVTTSATAYNTSSDYRLKENIAPMTGALAKVAALKPVTYTWKADGAAGEGFIAHELAEVCPQAVTGEKDAVDAEGKPQYQGIDVSFLVGTLTAAIQEQQTLIQQLTDRVAQLESN